MVRKLSGQFGGYHPLYTMHNWTTGLTNRANQWGRGLGDLGLGGIFRGIKHGIKPAINEVGKIAKDVGTKLAENVVQDIIAGKSLKTSVQDRSKQSKDIALQSALKHTLQRQKEKKSTPAPKRKREPSKKPPAKKRKIVKKEPPQKGGRQTGYKKHTKKQMGDGKKRVKKQSGSGKKRIKTGKKRGKQEPKDIFTSSKKQRGGSDL